MLCTELVETDVDKGPVTPDDGVISKVPSDDADAPKLPAGAPALRPPLGCV